MAQRQQTVADGHIKQQNILQHLKTSPRHFDKPFPFYREPVEHGRFSLDGNRQFHLDSSQLRVFAPPRDWNNCSLNLRDGYKDMIKRDESKKEFINDLLRWIKCNKHKFLSQPTKPASGLTVLKRKGTDDTHTTLFKSLNTDFVCWRGLLSRVLCTPYENQEDLIVAVIRFRGTYFMCEFDSDFKKKRNEQSTPRDEEMCAWGFKFEQYVTADRNSRVPDTKTPVNTNMAFCSVARTRLGSHSLVFGAEVDCEDANCKNGNSYIELKTSRVIETHRQHENFCKFKLIKWWAQSFLIGIPSIVCGFRDDVGVVHSLENFPLKKIVDRVKSAHPQPWKPNVCFNFLDTFLQFVKSNITTDDERCVYLLTWKPGTDVTLQKKGDDPEYHFLPDWFTKWAAWDKPCNEDHD